MEAIRVIFAWTMQLTGARSWLGSSKRTVRDDEQWRPAPGSGPAPGEVPEARNVLVSHVRNGKLAETWLYPGDQYAADEFFG